jgi:hypothetical protein
MKKMLLLLLVTVHTNNYGQYTDLAKAPTICWNS